MSSTRIWWDDHQSIWKGKKEEGEEGYWVVNLARLFERCELVLERHEVVALADWIDDVCGGYSERAEELTNALWAPPTDACRLNRRPDQQGGWWRAWDGSIFETEAEGLEYMTEYPNR